METDNQRLLYLMQRYIQNKVSADELEELAGYINNGNYHDDAILDAMEQAGPYTLPHIFADEDKNRVYKQLVARLHDAEPPAAPQIPSIHPTRYIYTKWIAAAVILIAATVSLLFYIRVKDQPVTGRQQVARLGADKHNRAFLTLANGKQLALSNTGRQNVSTGGNYQAHNNNGVLTYNDKGDSAALWNTLTVPKGATYQLVLADGTGVWLNTNSSITYPVAFSGKTREVNINGEAYFEVAHNPDKPFIVKHGNAAIQVLGTHFNVSAYADAGMVTTLLSGLVQVTVPGNEVRIKPNQEARLIDNKLRVTNVDATEAVAWRNGYFVFHNEDIKQVMLVIARWYDVDISYQGNMSGKTFGGTIARFDDLNKLLKSIELTGVIHFKHEGRRVIVMP